MQYSWASSHIQPELWKHAEQLFKKKYLSFSLCLSVFFLGDYKPDSSCTDINLLADDYIAMSNPVS